MRRALLALALLAGCGPDAPPAPTFELRDVVGAELAALAAAAPPPAQVVAEFTAREALEEILGPLRGGDPDLRALVVEDARALSPADLAGLVPVLRDAEEPAACRIGVAEILAAHATPPALEALCAVLETASEPWLRAQCAYQLGRAKADAVLPRLLLCMKYEKDYETAFFLADTCSRLGYLAGLEGMFVVWNGTQDEALRARVSQRVAELVAEHGAADSDELLARWKAGALAAAPQPSERLRLEAWSRIRALAEWNLRTVDDARFVLVHLESWVVPYLAEALHEREVYVRIHAAQCLERMGPRASAALPTLVEALNEPRTAPAAAAALGALGDERAAEPLTGLLEGSADPELRVAAALALGALGAPSARPALERAFDPAQPPDLRQAAAAALVRTGESPDAIALLLECMTGAAGDAGAAELALEAWMARRAEQSPEAVPVLERWRTAEPAGDAVPTDEELRVRREQRAALVRELVR